jgi:hypothetical protein
MTAPFSFSSFSPKIAPLAVSNGSSPANPNSVPVICNWSEELTALPFADWNLTLQPYWWILLAPFLLVLLAYVWFRGARACRDRPEEQQLLRDTPVKNVELSFFDSRFQLSNFYALQALFQLAHFVYILSTLHEGQSHWHQYEETYARFFNGGSMSIFFSQHFVMERLKRTDENTPEMSMHFRVLLVVLNILLCIPAFVTHILPGVMTFLPVSVLILAMIGVVGYMVDAVISRHPHLASLITMANLTVLPAALTILLQSSSNYALLLYRGYSWPDVIRLDWQLHSSSCYQATLNHGLKEMLWSFLAHF